MKKRYLTTVVLLALVICLALGVLALLPPRPGVTKANFDRIEVGMTKGQLEELLGRKSEYSISAEKIMQSLARSIDSKERYFIWTGIHGTAMIRIGLDERVVSAEWNDRDPTLYQQLRSLLPF